MGVFGTEIWLARGELFTVLARTFARFAPLEFYVDGFDGDCRAERCRPDDPERINCPSCWADAGVEQLATVVFDGFRGTNAYLSFQDTINWGASTYNSIGTVTMLIVVTGFALAYIAICAAASLRGRTEHRPNSATLRADADPDRRGLLHRPLLRLLVPARPDQRRQLRRPFRTRMGPRLHRLGHRAGWRHLDRAGRSDRMGPRRRRDRGAPRLAQPPPKATQRAGRANPPRPPHGQLHPRRRLCPRSGTKRRLTRCPELRRRQARRRTPPRPRTRRRRVPELEPLNNVPETIITKRARNSASFDLRSDASGVQAPVALVRPPPPHPQHHRRHRPAPHLGCKLGPLRGARPRTSQDTIRHSGNRAARADHRPDPIERAQPTEHPQGDCLIGALAAIHLDLRPTAEEDGRPVRVAANRGASNTSISPDRSRRHDIKMCTERRELNLDRGHATRLIPVMRRACSINERHELGWSVETINRFELPLLEALPDPIERKCLKVPRLLYIRLTHPAGRAAAHHKGHGEKRGEPARA